MPSFRFGLAGRVLVLAALFGAETLVATMLFELPETAPGGGWLTHGVYLADSAIARGLIGFAVVFATFAYLRYGRELAGVSKQAELEPVRGVFAIGHAAATTVFVILTVLLYGQRVAPAWLDLLSGTWLIAAGAAIACAALAVMPWRLWTGVLRATGWLWAYSAAAAVAAVSAESVFRALWRPASRLTLSLVAMFVRPFAPHVAVQPAAYRIATPRFGVIISGQCSGLEGIGLLLVFGAVFLVLFRDEIRLPRALVLFPIGILALYLLNAARIAALLLIGSAGAREIAKGGFHSQAGWLAFNAVLFGLVVTAQRWPWISTHPAADAAAAQEDPTSAFLVPFLCVLAAGMISRAATGTFEWLYGLRLLAAIVALWTYRRTYRQLEWRAGWMAPLAGAAVFAIWIALDRTGSAAAMPADLARAPEALRYGWIAVRILSAAVTVPIVEELAFRGYLMRRLVSADFSAVSFRTLTWFSLAGSSLLFGLMHGHRWLAGTLAGVLYGFVMTRRGRLGDAVVAHAATNALLAAYVMGMGKWGFW
ncbi:MAG TPA: exosortase E/protease, VPEID-CTERM system [Candidatus Acidoferrales bacterium]|nr:exosortase E/protease, VPEID-CTERM system [Candidatus Acidoferrales bacterium]